MKQPNENARVASEAQVRGSLTDRIKALNLTPEDIKQVRAAVNARFERLWGTEIDAQGSQPTDEATSSEA